MTTLKGKMTVWCLPVALVLALPAYSQTPDGMTPAEENVCDPLRSATPGLYGLCVAYCEAHDAEMISPQGDPNELNTPNQKILANYNRKKTESDPPMPCVVAEVEACPCWTSAELKEMEPPSGNYDHNLLHACRNTKSVVTLENYEFGAEGPGYQLSVYSHEGCYVRKDRFYQGGPAAGSLWASEEEEESCRTLLINHARAHKVDGLFWDCFEQ